LDEEALNEFLALQRRVDRRTEHIQATVIGVFETRTPIDDLVKHDGHNPYNGFGHMNAAPAQILVRTMTDMRIEDNK
jgi:hypothetical protein